MTVTYDKCFGNLVVVDMLIHIDRTTVYSGVATKSRTLDLCPIASTEAKVEGETNNK